MLPLRLLFTRERTQKRNELAAHNARARGAEQVKERPAREAVPRVRYHANFTDIERLWLSCRYEAMRGHVEPRRKIDLCYWIIQYEMSDFINLGLEVIGRFTLNDLMMYAELHRFSVCLSNLVHVQST